MRVRARAITPAMPALCPPLPRNFLRFYKNPTDNFNAGDVMHTYIRVGLLLAHRLYILHTL